jgi:GNAT superfamily N-acetyltransferase
MPNRFPQEALLRDGRRLLIRPFTANDTQALWELFQRLPTEVRRFAWDRIDDRGLVESWGRNLDYDKVFPLLAVDNGKVVADATLHFREHGPLRRTGRLKWLIDPEYRNQGLGTLMVNHFITTAKANGLRHLTCMLISDLEADAVKVLEELGFAAYIFPGYGTDPDGEPHDMTKLILEL